MKPGDDAIASHYGIGGLLQSILDGLAASGVDCSSLRPGDLAPIDEFHTRGREATLELAELVGLAGRVAFEHGSALQLPFKDASFDVVWTEHVQMNIADKGGFYREISRVLRPGGRLVFHDIFQGEGGVPHYPTPWAQSAALSALAVPAAARAAIAAAGMDITGWLDKSGHSLRWFRAALQRMQDTGPPPLGLHLLMGPTAGETFGNVLGNLEQGRITVVQGVACKPAAGEASALDE